MPPEGFGARYGAKPRKKFAQIRKLRAGRHLCPYCSKKAARRKAPGIWWCPSCRTKFSGRAYTP